jgi:hypothetical protein
MPFKNKADKDNYNAQYYKKNKPATNNINREFSTDHSDYCVQCKKYLTRGYLAKHQQTKAHKKVVADLIAKSR